MKTIAIEELPARREELLSDLAHGESLALTDHGNEVATLLPRRAANGNGQPAGDDSFYRLAEIAAKSTDEGSALTNEEIDRLVYGG